MRPMASCIAPSATSGSIWLTNLAISAFLAERIAAWLVASWPCGVDRDGFRFPPKAAFMSAWMPDRISASLGRTTPVGVKVIEGTLVVPDMASSEIHVVRNAVGIDDLDL